MSTTVRILILVGILVISIISYFICRRLAKKLNGNNPNGDNLKIFNNVCYGIALIVGIVLLFSYPDRVFLDIEKIENIYIIELCINVAMITSLIIVYQSDMKNREWSILIIIPVIIICIIIACVGMKFSENISKNSIEETNKTEVFEKITPFIAKQAKGIFVKYDDNGNVVSCKYYYIENNNLADNEIDEDEIEDVVYLENNEDSHIEKTETSIDYINHEMKPSSDQYTYTETKETYKLFLNKDQIVNVDN